MIGKDNTKVFRYAAAFRRQLHVSVEQLVDGGAAAVVPETPRALAARRVKLEVELTALMEAWRLRHSG